MRTKPLNPNSMTLIMENFRNFTEDLDPGDYQIDESKIYLFESESPAPSSERTFGSLLEDNKNDVIDEDVLFEQWDASSTYEYEQLLQEGVMDALKAPIKAFANTKAAMVAKKKARQAISIMGAKLFAGTVKILKAIIGKVKGLESKLLSTATQGEGGKVNTNAIVKIHQMALKLFGTAAKKLAAGAGAVISRILKVFNHPIFKAAVVVICAGILILSICSSAIFVGCLAAAPAYAAKRLGTKGAISFWKMIPNEAAQVAENINHLKAILAGRSRAKKQLLKEGDDVAAIFAQAIRTIAEDIPEGASVETDFLNLSSTQTDAATGEIVGRDYTWLQVSDDKLHTDLMAIRDLQLGLQGNSSIGFVPLDDLLSASVAADDALNKTIQNALRIAAKTCSEDPEMCQASKVLAQEFKTFNISGISSETTNVSKAIIKNGNVEEAWQSFTRQSYHRGTDTVIDTPFLDPAKAAGREAGKVKDWTTMTGGGTETAGSKSIAKKAGQMAKKLGRP